MADRRQRNPNDRGGGWFIDTTCIDCDVARQLAPDLIGEDDDGLSYFLREPQTDEEVQRAWRALLACPTASIGAPKDAGPPPADALPFEVADGVHYLGFTSRKSFGANAWYVAPDADAGRSGLMVDGPRWHAPLADAVEALGGIDHVFLTHRDDVADFARYADRFDARVWIHADERSAAPDATDVLELDATAGDVTAEVCPGVAAIHVPGHTRGSVLYLVDDRWLFTGDTLYWSRHLDDLSVFSSATWYSWEALTASMARLADLAASGEVAFEAVLPGHGMWGFAPAETMAERLSALVDRMRAGEVADVW